MPHTYALGFHIIVSIRICPKIDKLLTWIRSDPDIKYVAAYELGTNKHKHIDSFILFPTKLNRKGEVILKRQDHVVRDIRKLYSTDIDEEVELRNIQVKTHSFDSNPMYGWGYALKEQLEIYTNLTPEQQIEALEYYATHKEKVEDAISKINNIDKNKLTLKTYGNELLAFVTNYYQGKLPKETSHAWLIKEFNKSLRGRMDYAFRAKLPKIEIAEEWIDENLGDILLDCPLPTPPLSMSNSKYQMPMLENLSLT